MTTIEFAQKVKAKYPEYQNINDEELAKKVLEKYPEYRDRVDIGVTTTPATPTTPTAQPTTMPATPQKGILRQMGEAIVKPFAELGVSAVNLAKNVKSVATGENKDYSKQSYNLPYVGETKPAFTGDENFGDFAKKTVGYGAEVGSMFLGGGASKKAVTTGIKGLTKQAAITGLKEGAAIGGASSAGTSLREGNSLPQILKDTAVGVVGGGVLGGGLGSASGAVTNKVKLMKNVRAQKAAKGVDNFLNQVFQGKDEDIAIARKALTNLDLTGVKNYKDLTRLLNDNIKGISTRLDEVLDKDTSVKLLDNLNTLFDVDGQKIAKNFAKDAIEQLDELYTKTNDPVALAKIRNLATKANTQGLTTKEINDLAKTYGREFGKKAFSKMGDPLTSVNAQNYENTRKGVKELARRLYGNDAPRMADEELTNLIRVRDLSGKMVNKVNSLKQKVLKDKMGTRVVNAALKVSDFMTFGSLKGISKFFVPRGEGFKIANALDLEKNLTKSLKQIQKALKSQDEKEIYKILNSLLKLEKPAPLMLPAPGKTSVKPSVMRLPAKTVSTRDAEEIARLQAQINKNKKLPSKPAVLSKKKEVAGNTLEQEAKKYKSAEEFVSKSNPFPESKVKNTVYHGTNAEFDVFSKDFIGENQPTDFGQGFSFAKDKKSALGYAKEAGGNKVMEVKLNIKNPAKNEDLLDWDIQNAIDDGMGFKDVGEVLQEKGFDGIEFTRADGTIEYTVFNPEQIKTKSQLEEIWEKAQKLKSNPLIQEAEKTPKTVNVYVKSKFSEGGGYKDVPVIRKVDNVTLYQGSNAGDKRQFWTDSKKYASQFGEVKEKTGSFYQVDNGNRVTNVYVEVKPKTPLKSSTDSLIQEAKKYKSADEFIKAQGTPVYHGGTKIDEVGNMRSKWGAFYMTDNPTYAKSYGGNKSVLNEMVITPEAELADLRKPSAEIIKQIDEIISPKATGETLKIKKPDGSFVEVPKTKGGLSNPVHSSADIIQGIKEGKAYYAEMPEVKEALKKLGYDGMITQESKFGANYGVWNKDVIKTKSQLLDIWNKANKSKLPSKPAKLK